MILDYSTILKKARKNGGISVNKDEKEPKNGFMVSLINYEQKIKLKKLNEKTIKEYLNKHQRYFTKNMYFGIWIDRKTVYFDVSLNIQDERKAMLTGKANKQKAIFYIDEKKVIPLKS